MSLVAFDFDGTVIEGDAGVHLAKHLTGKGYLSLLTGNPLKSLTDLARLNFKTASLVFRNLSVHLRYKLGDLDRHGMVERAYRGFRGVDAEMIHDEMESFAREHLPDKLRESVVEQMRHHEAQGDHVVVVSTGIHDLIWPLREVIDVDFEVVACRLRRTNGELLGTVEGPMNGAEKCTRIMAIAKRRGHDLSEAWAYSDHEDDAVILRSVGNPVAVHPTRAMQKIARRNGWPILYDD